MSSLPPNAPISNEKAPSSLFQNSARNLRNLVATSALALTTACVTITTKPPQAMWNTPERYLQPEHEFVTNNLTLQKLYPLLRDFDRERNVSNLRMLKEFIVSEARRWYENNTFSQTQLSTLRDGITQKAQMVSWEKRWQYYNLSCALWAITDPRMQCQDIMNEIPEIKFSILNGRAKVWSREYILNPRNTPTITHLHSNVYEINMVFQRDSRSSIRGDETIKLHFQYDGDKITFFRDRNRNEVWDRYEWWRSFDITHTEEYRRYWNRSYITDATYLITLERDHISSSQNVRELQFKIRLKSR